MFGFGGGEYHLSLSAANFAFWKLQLRTQYSLSLSLFPCVSRSVPKSSLGFYGLNWKSKYLNSPV